MPAQPMPRQDNPEKGQHKHRILDSRRVEHRGINRAEEPGAVSEKRSDVERAAYLGVLEDAKLDQVVGLVQTRQRGGEVDRFSKGHMPIETVVQQIDGRADLAHQRAGRELLKELLHRRREGVEIALHLIALVAGEEVIRRGGRR